MKKIIAAIFTLLILGASFSPGSIAALDYDQMIILAPRCFVWVMVLESVSHPMLGGFDFP
jgi:hypothetical protein